MEQIGKFSHLFASYSFFIIIIYLFVTVQMILRYRFEVTQLNFSVEVTSV